MQTVLVPQFEGDDSQETSLRETDIRPITQMVPRTADRLQSPYQLITTTVNGDEEIIQEIEGDGSDGLLQPNTTYAVPLKPNRRVHLWVSTQSGPNTYAFATIYNASDPGQAPEFHVEVDQDTPLVPGKNLLIGKEGADLTDQTSERRRILSRKQATVQLFEASGDSKSSFRVDHKQTYLLVKDNGSKNGTRVTIEDDNSYATEVILD